MLKSLLKSLDYYELSLTKLTLFASAVSALTYCATLLLSLATGLPLFPLDLVLAFMVFYLLLTAPSFAYESEKFTVSWFLPLALSTFELVFLLTKSIFQACLITARADYPVISSAFSQVVERTLKGRPVENALNEVLNAQPLLPLKQGITHILSLSKAVGRGLEKSRYFDELQLRYSEETRSIETKFVFILTAAFFIPIFFLIFVNFYGIDLLGSLTLLIAVGALELLLMLNLSKRVSAK